MTAFQIFEDSFQASFSKLSLFLVEQGAVSPGRFLVDNSALYTFVNNSVNVSDRIRQNVPEVASPALCKLFLY